MLIALVVKILFVFFGLIMNLPPIVGQESDGAVTIALPEPCSNIQIGQVL